VNWMEDPVEAVYREIQEETHLIPDREVSLLEHSSKCRYMQALAATQAALCTAASRGACNERHANPSGGHATWCFRLTGTTRTILSIVLDEGILIRNSGTILDIGCAQSIANRMAGAAWFSNMHARRVSHDVKALNEFNTYVPALACAPLCAVRTSIHSGPLCTPALNGEQWPLESLSHSADATKSYPMSLDGSRSGRPRDLVTILILGLILALPPPPAKPTLHPRSGRPRDRVTILIRIHPTRRL
jgi:hypothetical protein